VALHGSQQQHCWQRSHEHPVLQAATLQHAAQLRIHYPGPDFWKEVLMAIHAGVTHITARPAQQQISTHCNTEPHTGHMPTKPRNTPVAVQSMIHRYVEFAFESSENSH
jgi:hypothetical protein